MNLVELMTYYSPKDNALVIPKAIFERLVRENSLMFQKYSLSTIPESYTNGFKEPITGITITIKE